jgi:UDP-N-acetylglucosamine 3-dehydrogenase
VPFRDLVRAEELKVEDYEPLRRELESFVECVRAGARPVVSGEDGLRAVRTATLIADEIRRGLRSIGRPPQAS